MTAPAPLPPPVDEWGQLVPLDENGAPLPHNRSCFGCGEVDDGPRVRYVPPGHNFIGATAEQAAAAEKLYHPRCFPKGLHADHPEIAEHAKLAARHGDGDKLRAALVKRAASRAEDPADPLEQQPAYQAARRLAAAKTIDEFHALVAEDHARFEAAVAPQTGA
jgi:hypothetical protein